MVFSVHGETVEEGPAILTVMGQVWALRLSPDNKHVAIVAEQTQTVWVPDGAGGLCEDVTSHWSLQVAAAKAGAVPTLLSPRIWSIYVDWSGRSVVYVREPPDRGTLPASALVTTTLVSQKVLADDGAMLKEMPVTELASVVGGSARIWCLADGRILFISGDVKLPDLPAAVRAATQPSGGTSTNPPGKVSLFVIDPEREVYSSSGMVGMVSQPPRVVRFFPPFLDSDAPAPIDTFQVSPDGRRVAVAGEDGWVGVIDVAENAFTVVQSPQAWHDSKDTRLWPAWRNNEELCFVAPAQSPLGTAGRGEIVVWSQKGARLLSKNWPDSIAPKWMLAAHPDSQPAASQSVPATTPASRPTGPETPSVPKPREGDLTVKRETRNDVQMTIKVPKIAHAGEPILLDVAVTNLGRKVVEHAPTGVPYFDLEITLTDSQKRPVRKTLYGEQWMRKGDVPAYTKFSPHPILSGMTVHSVLNLSKFFDLTQSGTYLVSVKDGMLGFGVEGAEFTVHESPAPVR
jgi:hypothetical protein